MWPFTKWDVTDITRGKKKRYLGFTRSRPRRSANQGLGDDHAGGAQLVGGGRGGLWLAERASCDLCYLLVTAGPWLAEQLREWSSSGGARANTRPAVAEEVANGRKSLNSSLLMAKPRYYDSSNSCMTSKTLTDFMMKSTDKAWELRIVSTSKCPDKNNVRELSRAPRRGM